MVRVNPDERTRRYASVPKGAVTAFFAPGQDFEAALTALNEAGFGQDQIDVFTGEEGAESLDMEGRHHGRFVRLLRLLEDKLTDDAYLYHRTDELLRAGSTLIAVFSHGKRSDRERAIEILRESGGTEPVYWGKWITETF
jgi:hypothetical protein